MNDSVFALVEPRIRRLERQNRFLVALLCATVGIASLAATKRGLNVISVDELRTQRITLVDNHGAVVHSWWGANGAMNE
jgi:hypothetical protein